MKLFGLILFLLSFGLTSARASVSPAAAGWGNLLVPGLGATLRGQGSRAILEAAIELGLFYGGTFGVREGVFNIDTTIVLPERGKLWRPLLGQSMQQVGLKLHMYDTFYHYQQAVISAEAVAPEPLDLQPLYRGGAGDLLWAPFRWANLSNPWVYGFLLAAGTYVAYTYHHDPVAPSVYRPSSGEDLLFGVNQMALFPMGSAFGEEALFRGMIQREFHRYSGSFLAACLVQAGLFSLIHAPDDRLAALAGGIYFGYLTYRSEGNLEASVAAHFWVNLLTGLADYLRFRVAHGSSAPWSPKVSVAFLFPLS